MRFLPDNSVDLIVTDPPYAKKYDYLYGQMAEEAKRILVVGKSLVTLCGHYQIPKVINDLSEYLKYRWTICLYQPGSQARLSMGIQVGWKPMLWFVNEKLSPRRCVVDIVTSGKRSKETGHPWEQGTEYAHWAIENLTDAGDTVLDPFMGSGTTGVACVNTGRDFIGMELEEKYYDVSGERINEALNESD